ncbi:MAG: zinc-binding alcohol dehydrogenase family protein [Thermoflavifilum sp.]|nr:zinc-binding alcohol dehydrogenase family protein [Thermoflavifilum sp.]
MHTWILNQPGQFTVVQPAHPHNPAPGEALVKVHRMGLCGTDYHAYRGEQPYFAYPRLLGHELGVEVLAIGQGVSEVRVGDRCAVRPYLACGQCDACLRGYPNACEQIKVLGVHTDGGLQLFLTLPASQLHRSGKLSFDDLALVEPLSIGAHAVNRAKIKAEDRVLILGAGPIGLAVATFAGFHQPQQLVVADVQAQRLRLLSQLSFPQTPQPLPLAQHPLEEILSSFGGKNPTVIFDATGHPQSMEQCFSYAAHGGTIVYVGLCRQTLSFSDPLFHQKELSLLASRNSQPADFDQIIHLMENGHLHTKAWITHRYPLSQLPQAFETIFSSAGDICLKAMIATDA